MHEKDYFGCENIQHCGHYRMRVNENRFVFLE
jgi:hypothetical protein